MKFLGIFNVKERKGRNNFIGETMTTKKLYMGIASLLLGCMLMTSPLVARAETDPDFPDETNSIDDVDIQNKKQTIVEGTQITPIKIVPTITGEWTKVDERELGLMGLKYDMGTYLITGKYNLREPWGKDEEVKKVFEAIKVIRHDSRVENRRLVFIVQRDTDRDGIPDITDTDDDNDGYTDVEEKAKGSDPKNAKSIPATPIIPAQVQPVRPSTGRINDKDRVGTAINISKKYYNKANTVIVVRHDLFPDSMTASVLAKLKDAPILLNPTDKLDNRVSEEIKRLGVEEVIIVGGRDSISEGVREELKAFDTDKYVERLSGPDRYGTSEMVARRVVAMTGKKYIAVVASGQVFPDALSVGTFASRESYPILLVKKDLIPERIERAINDLDINRTYIAGGTNTISKETEAKLPGVLERMAGNTRYETSVAIAKSKFKDSKEAFVASGEEFADALVISPISGKYNKPTLLVSRNISINSVVKKYIKEAKLTGITAIGGEKYVPNSTINDLTR
jgi:conserved domain protein